MEHLIYASMLIWGIKCLFDDGYLFHFNKDGVPPWVKKPLTECPPCMSSIWGTMYYWLIQSPTHSAGGWVVFCIMLCGFNYFIVQLIDKERIIIDDDDN